ncbi:SDR family NAD(P)-dependent oxidoreductase [Leifsonia shinshuensis]|uniref:SDR family NAD(P)-dependent oxidoreductase n=1 Tax=Leifsonia shinshuensis TaxID=150026 RepID=UPI0016289257|nr:SDR family NAD(P)-dependent oxidoreductase [Leifsonia shinshuensis]
MAIVTGGGTGIGYATAEALVGQGWTTVIAGRRADLLWDAAERLRDAAVDGAEVAAVPTDISVESSVRDLVASTVESFGRINALVSNAGILDVRPFAEMTPDAWRTMFDVVVTGAALASMAVVPHMRAQGQGRIVLVGSVSGIISDAGLPHYSAAKAALHSLARGLTVDLALDGIVANAVAPGWIRTPMNDVFIDDVDAGFMRRLNPLSRAADPAEVAEVIRYLVSEAPAFLAGTTIPIDGGQSAMNHYYG